MITHKKYQFVHMPKCAGTFIRTMLKKYFDGIQVEAPFSQNVLDKFLKKGVYLPEDFSLVVNPHKEPPKNSYKELNLGCIRHPYTWYLSLYSYNCRGLGIGRMSDRFKSIYPEMSYVLEEESPANFQKWIKTLHTRPCTIGLMTNEFKRLYRVPNKWSFIRFENVVGDLFKNMESLNMLDEEKSRLIMEEKKINTTPKKDWQEFHTEETKQLIRKYDHQIFDSFYKEEI